MKKEQDLLLKYAYYRGVYVNSIVKQNEAYYDANSKLNIISWALEKTRDELEELVDD